MSRRAKSAITADIVAGMSLVAFTATNLTQPWEDKRNVAYWDAIGNVWTVCWGEPRT